MLMVGGLNTGITHNTLANISIQPFCSEHLCLFLFSGSEYVQDICWYLRMMIYAFPVLLLCVLRLSTVKISWEMVEFFC